MHVIAITTTLVDGATVGVCSTVTPADESSVLALLASESWAVSAPLAMIA